MYEEEVAMFEALESEGFEGELKGDVITVRHPELGEKSAQISDTPAEVVAGLLADELRNRAD